MEGHVDQPVLLFVFAGDLTAVFCRWSAERKKRNSRIWNGIIVYFYFALLIPARNWVFRPSKKQPEHPATRKGLLNEAHEDGSSIYVVCNSSREDSLDGLRLTEITVSKDGTLSVVGVSDDNQILGSLRVISESRFICRVVLKVVRNEDERSFTARIIRKNANVSKRGIHFYDAESSPYSSVALDGKRTINTINKEPKKIFSISVKRSKLSPARKRVSTVTCSSGSYEELLNEQEKCKSIFKAEATIVNAIELQEERFSENLWNNVNEENTMPTVVLTGSIERLVRIENIAAFSKIDDAWLCHFQKPLGNIDEVKIKN
eukprot:jgi/Bigna1/81908/fgenesh1_pg.85_\